MNKSLSLRMIPMLLALLTLCGLAAAETVAPGNVPERGIILDITEEDVSNGLNIAYTMASTAEVSELPLLMLTYTDVEGMNKAAEKYENMDLSNQELLYEALTELSTYVYSLYEIALFETEYYSGLIAAGRDMAAINPDTEVFIMGENGGYTYVALNTSSMREAVTPEQQVVIDAAASRAKELLLSASYQEIVFAPGEITEKLDAFPTFATAALDGSAVDSSIFSEKDLTVVNVWATWCGPCVSEMPDLQEWYASMPDNVQIIGLTADLTSLDDEETLETAKMIAEATGVTYPLLVANEDFTGLLGTLVGYPTTFFVDSNGHFVGSPIVGVNIPGYIAAVESYLSSLQ